MIFQANRSVNDVDEKINQAVQKRQVIVSNFVTKTKENLDAKMEESQEKREAHLNSLKTKLKEHVCRLFFHFFMMHLMSRLVHYCVAGTCRNNQGDKRDQTSRDSSANRRETEIR